MLFSLVALGSYSILLLLSVCLDSSASDSQSLVARLIVFLSLLIGLVFQLRRSQYHRTTTVTSCKSIESIKYKVLAIRLCLVALIVFSTLMSQFFYNWPGTIFNSEFLLALPLLLLLTSLYVRWAERISPSDCDGYARLGQLIMRERHWQWSEQKELLLAWLVKLIFIPLMYSWLMMATEDLLAFNWSLAPSFLIKGLFMYGLAADLLIATAGYLFATRLLGNAVISTDKTWGGWVICLLCYPPLIWIYQQVMQQSNNLVWTDWLQPDQLLFWFWAAAVTLTWIIYWLSTLHFGLRFANLSWRGLVSTGPYRWVKHPAYLSKNLYWWLYLVPFYGVTSSYELIRNFLGLCFVSLVYFLRAYTEERHLMQFAEYRNYVELIRNHGLLARIKRWRGIHA